MVTFRTTLVAGGGNNVGIAVPDDVVAGFNRGKRVPVVITVDGDYRYRNTISSMGGRFLISFNAETRAATGRGAGDEVEIRLELDGAPRTVDPPPELAAVPGVAASWAKLAPSRQRAYADSIAGAKTDETRERRVAKILAELGG